MTKHLNKQQKATNLGLFAEVRKALFLTLLCCSLGLIAFTASAQVSTNGGSGLAPSYPTLNDAILALNGAIISSPVVITLQSDEIAPAGGYVITAEGSAVNTISILGGGNTVTASAAHTVGALNDAIIKLVGADFVTIQNFVMQENALNTITAAASNNMTEWAVALLYATTVNGAQNNTIQNNTISLNRVYQNTFGIYSNSTHSPTVVSTTASATGTAGANSGLRIFSNTISNVNNGITVVGPTAAADHNQILEIGGSALLGNTINNYGTTGTFSAFANVSGTVNGILVRNTVNYTISHNSITSSTGAVTVGTLRAIFVPAFNGTPLGTLANSISNNSISLQSGNLTGALQGIIVEGTTGNATTSINISNNDFTSIGYSATSSGIVTLISQATATLSQNINGNTFSNLSVNNTGSFIFISNSVTVPATGTQSISNNQIVGTFAKTGAGGTVTLCTSSASSTAGAVITHANNNFSNITVTGATTIAGWISSDGGTANKNYINNTFSNWTGGTNAMTGMSINFGGGAGGNGNFINQNTITNFTGAGAVTGIIAGGSGNTTTISQNTVSGLTSTGTGAVIGISCAAPTASFVLGNTVCNLESNNATGGIVSGILIVSGIAPTVANNVISDLRAPLTSATTDAIRGISVTSATALSNVKIYHNTVLLAATSTGANFSTSAIFHTTNTTATTAALDMRNNIFVNNSTANGTGVATAYRRSTTVLTNFSSASNNNDFVGAAIFYDGTNTDFTLIDYKTRVDPIDVNSISVNPTFLSTVCGNSNFLRIDPTVVTAIEGGGVNIAGITTDIDGDIRAGNPGYLGAGLAPDMGADEFESVLPSCTSADGGTVVNNNFTVCSGNSVNIFSTGFTTGPGISYQWKIATVSGGPYTNVSSGTGATTPNYTTDPLLAGTYFYVLETTCSAGPVSDFSNEVTVTVNLTPTVTASPATTDICYPLATPVTITASGADTYVWSPAASLSASTGTTVDATPSSSTVYNIVGTALNGCTATATSAINLSLTPAISNITATPSAVCVGGNAQLEVQAVLPSVLITEVTVFRTGTGATSPYPAYATGADLVELSNISSNPIDISGYVISAFGDNATTASHTLTFPAGTVIPTNGVAIVCLGTGTDNIANLYFNTGGTSDTYFSTARLGVVLYNGTSVVDAVGLGGNPTTGSYTFNAATGVTASDWTGFAPNGSGLAGTIRTAATDNNSGSDWSPSATALLQSIGTYNGTYVNSGTISYNWAPAANLDNATIANPLASIINSTTVYTVTATSNGCSETASVTVTAGVALNASASTSTPLVCEAVNVTLEATPVGGGGPYTYAWSGPAFSSTDQNPVLTSVTTAMSGTYSVTITDNCGSTATASTSLTVNPIPVMSVTPATAIYCSPGGAAITMTASGADTYSWSPATGLSATTGATVDATPTSSTNYTVVGTTTATGCTASTTAIVTVSPAVTITAANATPAEVCAGGTSQLEVTTATFPVNAYVFNAGSGATLQDMTGATVGVPSSVDDTPMAAPASIGFTFNFNGTNYTQFSVSPDGWILLGGATAVNQFTNTVTSATNIPKIYPYWDDLATGTNGNVSYLLTGTAPNRILVVEWFVTIPRNTTGAANSTFQAWLYENGRIEFRYGNMNTATSTTISGGLTAATNNFQSITFATNSASSSTPNDANPLATPANGTIYSFVSPSYNYSWAPAALLNNATVSNPIASGITTNTTFTVTVSANGCEATADVTVSVSIPSVLTGTTDATCTAADGTATATVTGSATPYSFLWSNGQTDANATGLTAGTYGVTFTDANGCTGTASATVNSNSGTLATTASATASTCIATDGTATVNITGGTAPFTTTWSNGGNTTAISSLAAGTYTVTVTDANGCESTASTTVTATSGTLSVSATAVDAVCTTANGSATATITGGTAPFITTWSNGGNTTAISSLAAGTYTVTVTDANGCESTASTTVTATSGTLSVSATAVDAVCTTANGSATATITGGTAPFTTTWSNGGNTTAISSLAAGTYTVTVTDANGCESTASTTVAATSGTLSVSATAVDAICTAANGSATATITGGTAPFSYLWNSAATDATLTSLTSGSFSVTVTDANGCFNSASVTVNTNPSNLVATVTPADAICTSANGSAVATNTGGTAPFSYLWSNAANTNSITGLVGGTYTVTITDDNGCESTASALVATSTGNLSLAATTTQELCTSANGTATVSTTGGTAPFSFVWSNGNTDATATGLSAGAYTATVTDANGCVETSAVTVGTNSGTLTATASTTAALCLASTGSATAVPANGTAPYAYIWSNGGTDVNITGLAAGTYAVTISDANGCETIINATVNTSNGNFNASATASNALCTAATGTATATVNNGTAPIGYVWNNAATTSALNNLAPGNYAVTATDANGCVSTANATVGSDAGNISATSVSTDVTANAANDGTIDLTVSGGTAPISYLWSNGETTEDLSGLIAGNYSVTITDANGCVFIENVTINQPPVAIALTASNWTANIFPNPADQQTMVAVELGTIANVRIRLVNSLGQIIQSVEYSDVMNVQHSLNVSDLPAAMYMVEITADGVQKVQRLVLTRK
jgi:trimeric autotransporter adhesin